MCLRITLQFVDDVYAVRSNTQKRHKCFVVREMSYVITVHAAVENGMLFGFHNNLS